MAIRCAPAPSSEPPADNKTVVGSSNASVRRWPARGRWAVSPSNSGKHKAARAEVDGNSHAVAPTSAVRRQHSVEKPG